MEIGLNLQLLNVLERWRAWFAAACSQKVPPRIYSNNKIESILRKKKISHQPTVGKNLKFARVCTISKARP